MREKLNSLPLSELREIAKSQGVRSVTTKRKSELVEILMELYERENAKKAPEAPEAPKQAAPKEEKKEEKRQPARTPHNNRRRPEGLKKPVSAEHEEAAPHAALPHPVTSADPTIEETAAAPEASVPAEEVQKDVPHSAPELDSGLKAEGILEVMQDGYGFIRSGGYLPGEEDVYVAPSQIKRFNLRTGDIVYGNKRVKGPTEKFSAILYIEKINGVSTSSYVRPVPFENLTPVFPHERLYLETAPTSEISMRIVDLLSPIGKGQRGMIVAQPKVGKTTLLKQIATALKKNHPELYIIVLLIDERPEEVTDMQESIGGENTEVVYSTFDELPERHKRISEMVIERAKRMVEMKRDVVILLDSITRLTRACNITVTPSGRTLSGGLDPAALYMPKRFFGAARCMREGGSLTILATALFDTGSRLDDVVYEEFKGTGNMELVLNRKLSERRIFPAIDILKSSTRRDDLLLSKEEQEAAAIIHRATSGARTEEYAEQILDLFASTKTNREFTQKLRYVVF